MSCDQLLALRNTGNHLELEAQFHAVSSQTNPVTYVTVVIPPDCIKTNKKENFEIVSKRIPKIDEDKTMLL